MADLVTEKWQAKPDRSQQLEILDCIGTTIASDLALDSIVQQVTDCATELAGAQFGAFFYNVLNDQGESYMLFALAGVPRSAFEGFGMPRNTAVFDHTFRGLLISLSQVRSLHHPPLFLRKIIPLAFFLVTGA